MGFRYVLMTLLMLSMASAAELKQETLEAWDRYVMAADMSMQMRLHPSRGFLWADEVLDRNQRLRAGEILVAPVSSHSPTRVPSGLIHHWIGAAFIPNAKLDSVLSVVRDYAHYKDYYRPTVIGSAPGRQSGFEDEFSLVMMNNSYLKSAIESQCRSSFTQVNPTRWYSVSHSIRVEQVDNYGGSREHKLPADEGNGYIWRLHSISRYEERDGGVYLEVEALVLSRDIPGALRWVVDPIVRRVAKSSLVTSLRETQDATNDPQALAKASSPHAINEARAFVKQ